MFVPSCCPVCNRLCCITQVRSSRLVTASVDWISVEHLGRVSQTFAGRSSQRRHRSRRSISEQRRIGRQDIARSHRWHPTSHDWASGTIIAVLSTHRHSPPSSSQTRHPRRLTFARHCSFHFLLFYFFFVDRRLSFPILSYQHPECHRLLPIDI